MTDIKKIRKVVEILRTFSEKEWEVLEEVISRNELPQSVIQEADDLKLSYYEKEKKVAQVLKNIGIPASIKGYQYLKEGIILLIDNPGKYNLITKELYPSIAKKFGATSSRVERAIRHAIDVAWGSKRSNIELQNDIFGCSISSEKGKPTNSEAVSALAEYMNFYIL